MTPKKRLYARLENKEVDKIPNLNIVMMFAAKFAGIPYSEFCLDYKKLVDAQSITAEHFNIDIMSTMSDPYRETSGYGASLEFPHDGLPLCKQHLITDIEHWEKSIKGFDPLNGGRIDDRVKAAELFSQRYGNQYPILGWVEGPLAELADLTGVNEVMYSLVDYPDEVKQALDFICDQQIKCALAQVDAGADIIGVGDAVASLISRNMYDDMVFEYEKALIAAIHNRGAKVKLHICGNINHILPKMVETQADIIDIDYYVDYKKAVDICGSGHSVCGNIDPVSMILQSTPEKIIESVKSCVAVSGLNSLISSGCEIPRDTPYENVLAIDKALSH